MLNSPAYQFRQVPDRRQAPRRSLRYLRVFSPVPGHVFDLSRLGMSLETPAELEEGREYTFRIRYRSILFSLSGRIQWCKPSSIWYSPEGDSIGLYRSGVVFSRELPIESLEFLVDDEVALGDS